MCRRKDQRWSPRGDVLASRIFEDILAVFGPDIGTGSQVLIASNWPRGWHFDSITFSDNNDVSAICQPLYESTGVTFFVKLILGLYVILQNVSTLFFEFNDVAYILGSDLVTYKSHTWPWRASPLALTLKPGSLILSPVTIYSCLCDSHYSRAFVAGVENVLKVLFKQLTSKVQFILFF